ncbi:S8 family peptidase [Bacillus cereus]|uniref:Peptidase S8/S53 domain-containing protein n=1 Tax=Bacillus cereus TaxID=1396 RepID=A0A9X7LUV8_BACCE|nr:S8 family peptidase [Bacillus cereus]QDZ73456.1 hypothetical protein D0437_10210 [Bacillus cereus]
MSEKIMLMLSEPTIADRGKGRGGSSRKNFPSRDRQGQRLGPKFARLFSAVENQRASMVNDMSGHFPEQALVLETVDPVEEFIKAVQKVDGLEWLAEWNETMEADEDFYCINKDGDKEEKSLGGRLFLIMSDQRAMQELKSLWEAYIAGQDFPRGFTKWRDVFTRLKNIREWDTEDRLHNTGFLEDWEERLRLEEEEITFEIELWYRVDDQKRRDASREIRRIISETHGQVLKEVIIPEIRYHSLLIKTPIAVFHNLKERQDISIIKCDYVMFIRPVGQTLVDYPKREEHIESQLETSTNELLEIEPVIALLDGLPLQNHVYLANRVIIDDPDGFESDYPAKYRIHGTAMASLILYGELDEQAELLPRPIYCRPIMKPDYRAFEERECVPEDTLSIDLVYRAVRRMFESEGDESPAAPRIKIINLSMGDYSRPFDRTMSPWARLLDYLSYKYRVLFVVSAGNCPQDLYLDIPRDEFTTMDASDIEKFVVESIHNTSVHRRILSPAESMNALTVGAIHSDHSQQQVRGRLKDVINTSGFISPITRVGLGIRNSIKPDILFPGGKQLYVEDMVGYEGKALLRMFRNSSAPGQKVAYPGGDGKINEVLYTRGTSNANALATRTGGLLYEKLNQIYSTYFGEEFPEPYVAVVLKSLLVHGASWGESINILNKALRTRENAKIFRDKIASRYLGYGAVNTDRIFECTDSRVTLLGFKEIGKEEGHIYTIPLPSIMSGKVGMKRLTITLAWFTPINADSQKYRKASLWFDAINNKEFACFSKRKEADDKAVKRGTLQHEVFEGEEADVFVDGTNLLIKVSCKEDAMGLTEKIPYSLIVTLEVAEELELPIYNEVRTLITSPVVVQP